MSASPNGIFLKEKDVYVVLMLDVYILPNIDIFRYIILSFQGANLYLYGFSLYRLLNHIGTFTTTDYESLYLHLKSLSLNLV